MSHDTDAVLAIERGFWTAADDPRFFEENVADEGLSVIEPMGAIEKRKAVQMTADQPWSEVELLDLVVKQPRPDLIVLSYHGKGKRADGKSHSGSIASTYAKLDGRWQLVLTAHQPWKGAAS